MGGLVTENELKRLPVNGRNYTRLILLMPGASNRGGAQSQGTFSGTANISVNGQRQQDNNFTVDGVDNNFMFQNSPGASPPMDSISEFRVLSNTSAEFGRSAGANVTVVTKSGTRSLRGSLYEYLRNDKLDANDFFANRLGAASPPFGKINTARRRADPSSCRTIMAAKTLSGSSTGKASASARGQVQLSTVPTAAQRQGDFSAATANIYDPFSGTLASNGAIVRTAFPGRRIPETLFNKATNFYLQQVIPMPNLPGTANNYLNTPPGG